MSYEWVLKLQNNKMLLKYKPMKFALGFFLGGVAGFLGWYTPPPKMLLLGVCTGIWSLSTGKETASSALPWAPLLGLVDCMLVELGFSGSKVKEYELPHDGPLGLCENLFYLRSCDYSLPNHWWCHWWWCVYRGSGKWSVAIKIDDGGRKTSCQRQWMAASSERGPYCHS